MTSKTLMIVLAILVNTNYSYKTLYNPFYRRRQPWGSTSFSHPYDYSNLDTRLSPLYRREVPPHAWDDDYDDDGRVEFPESRNESPASAPVLESRNDTASWANHDGQTIQTRQGGIAGTKCKFGFCEEAENYPEAKIKEMLSKTKKFDAFSKLNSVPDIAMKSFGGDNFCSSTVETTYPRIARNLEEKQRYIVNVDNFKQGIQMEICNSDQGKGCMFNEFWPQSYGSLCKQKMTVTPMLVEGDDGDFMIDIFRTPSCCVCMYTTL